MEGLLKLLREALPEIIGSIIGGLAVEVVLAIIGKQIGVGIWPVIVIIVGCVWAGCAYLAFKRTPPLVEGSKGTWQHPRWRPWALAGMAIILLLTVSGVGYHLYQQAQPPTKVILLVADFDGPEPQKYRVTETVLARLRAALEPYDDVQVEAIGRAITEAEGSAAARAEGEKRQAAIVIWGWYGVTAEAVPLSVHFEVLRPPKYMPELGPEAKGQVQKMAVAELESFTLQTRLSDEMAYLSLFTVGVARFAAEDWEEAVKGLSDALSQIEGRVPALDQSTVHFYRGVAYALKRDLDQAIADFDQAIQFQPDYAEAYNNRGLAYDHKGEYDRAIADFDQAIQLSPDDAAAYNNRGIAYADKGDYDRAIADYDQAIKLNPNLAGAYYNRGLAYDHKGEYDRAIADFDWTIRLQPHLAEAYVGRGAAYNLKGEYDQAIADFDQAIKLQASCNACAYNNRGNAYRAQGDYDRAIADYDQAIQLKPDFALAYKNRGEAYHAQGDYDQAIADYHHAIYFQRDFADAYSNLGNAHYSKGDYDRAIADYTKAIELQPDHADAYVGRGAAYASKGDYDHAIADYGQAIQLRPGLAEAYYYRGKAYTQKGEKEKAIADFEKFLELSNDPYWRQQAEEQLKALGAR